MCTHHWMLGQTTPTGIPAVCKKCLATRWFRAPLITWREKFEAPTQPADLARMPFSDRRKEGRHSLPRSLRGGLRI